MSSTPFITVDIELTNRCNAKCYFCPRDQTPHQGLMSADVFDQSLARTIELRQACIDLHDTDNVRVSLCGLGEPLLNPRAADAVKRVKDAGFECVMSSNGSILDERKGRALIDAGLDAININVGDRDDEYDEIYKLPFDKTRDNVVRFAEMAGDDCTVSIVLVDYRRDREHIKEMVRYWKGLGLDSFVFFDIMNRGGALFVDQMQYELYAEAAQARQMLESRGGPALCAAPFIFVFVGYDGNYYLCCSDWKKQVSFGSVFDRSMNELVGAKMQAVTTREPICKTCNWDPLNILTEELRALEAGESDAAHVDALVDDLMSSTATLIENAAIIEAHVPGVHRRSIPVTAI